MPDDRSVGTAVEREPSTRVLHPQSSVKCSSGGLSMTTPMNLTTHASGLDVSISNEDVTSGVSASAAKDACLFTVGDGRCGICGYWPIDHAAKCVSDIKAPRRLTHCYTRWRSNRPQTLYFFVVSHFITVGLDETKSIKPKCLTV